MGEYSYIGKGELLVAPYDGTAGLRKIGNVHALDFALAEDKKELQDFTKGGGGLANSLARVSSVEAKINARDFIAENIALAVYGDASAVAAGSATSESHVGYHDQYIALDKHINPAAIVVKDQTDVTTYVLDTDYAVESNGLIKILSTGGIADGETLHISYDYGAYNSIQALRNSGKELRAVFVGLNEAQTDKPVVVTIHKLKFGPASNLPFIGDDFGSLELTGAVIKDSTITGAGLSQFFKVDQQEA